MRSANFEKRRKHAGGEKKSHAARTKGEKNVKPVEGNRKENVTFTIFENFNSVDLTVYQCGREKCLPGHLFGPASRDRKSVV